MAIYARVALCDKCKVPLADYETVGNEDGICDKCAGIQHESNCWLNNPAVGHSTFDVLECDCGAYE